MAIAASQQWHVHKGKGGPVLVQYALSNQQQLELWVHPPGIAEAGFIVNEVFNEGEYLKHGVTLKPGDTVVDVGANIGVFGARALSAVPGRDLSYLGIEPCPQSYALLQQNLLGTDGQGQQNSMFHINPQALAAPLEASAAAADGDGGATGRSCPAYPGNVCLVQAAVSSSSGSCSITYYPHMPGNSTMRPEEKQQLQQSITQPKFLEGAETFRVQKTTLPQLLADQGMTGPISLLKIDVEGEELEVLRGLDRTCWTRVQQVALEVHDCIDEPLPHQDTAEPATNGAAAAAAAAIYARFPRLQAIMAGLPGPRTAKDIDGDHIRYNPLPSRVLGQQAPADIDPAKAAVLQALRLPPPRDEGRVMVVAKLLQQQGFRVVIECSLGVPMNYTVYGVRPQQQQQQQTSGRGLTL